MRPVACYSTWKALWKPGNPYGIRPFLAFLEVKFHPVALLYFVDEPGLVDENFFLVVVGDNEAEAFGVVVKLNGTGEHSGRVMMRWRCPNGPWLPGGAGGGVNDWQRDGKGKIRAANRRPRGGEPRGCQPAGRGRV